MSRNTLKKRELLLHLNDIISSLVNISGDVCKLEINDNWQASRRVRKELIDVRKVKIPKFEFMIKDIREGVKSLSKEKKELTLESGTSVQRNHNNLKK